MTNPAPPAAASDAAIALRGLAGVIRKHGTCAPMALEVIAERLEAAPPIAQQGGVEVTDAMVENGVDAAWDAYVVQGAGIVTVKQMRVIVCAALTAALASKADGGES